MRKLLWLLLLSTFMYAQAPIISPVPKLQFFAQNGVTPLANGCVFTYQSGTNTPLVSYTDYTGIVQNTNPVILNSGGFASIWLQPGTSYRYAVYANGGTNCALGSLQYTVDGIAGSSNTTTTPVTFSSTPSFNITSQVQLFTITLTGNATALPLTATTGVQVPSIVIFQITEDNVGNHTFTWPSNMYGAPISISANSISLQTFIWNGSIAVGTGPISFGTPPLGSYMSGDGIFMDKYVNITTGGFLQFTNPSNGSIVNAMSIDNNSLIHLTPSNTGFQPGSTANPALSGQIRLGNADKICWRNGANTADQCQGAASGSTYYSGTGAATGASNPLPVNAQVLPSGYLNRVGATIRIHIGMAANGNAGGGITNQNDWLSFGTTPSLGGNVPLNANAGVGTSLKVNAVVECITTTTGVTGILNCAAIPYSDNQGTVLPNVTVGGMDLTGNVYVGGLCGFSGSNLSNSCNIAMESIELLN